MARKFLAALLAVVVSGMLALPTFAEAVTETIDNGDGTTTQQTTTTTTTTDPETGNVDVTVTIEKNTSGVTTDGTSVFKTEVSTTTTVTDGNGELIKETFDEVTKETQFNGTLSTSQKEVSGGVEYSKETQSPENVTVKVPLTEGETGSTEFGMEGEIVKGDLPESENDGNYDYTITKDEEKGEVSVTVKDVDITATPGDSEMERVYGDEKPSESNDLVTETPSAAPEDPTAQGDISDGYQYEFIGTGNTSQFRPAVVFTEPLSGEEKEELLGGSYYFKKAWLKYYPSDYLDPYENIARDENGNVLTDSKGYIVNTDGERIIRRELTVVGPDGETYYLHRVDALGAGHNVEGWYQDGEWLEEIGGDKYGVVYATAQQFVLMDRETGDLVTVYCADVSTRTEDGFGYNVENLEDATYYDEDQAKQIRSIALNGYWGTTGYQTDAEGNTVLDAEGNPMPAVGSLDALKATLLASGEFSEDELAILTDGVALTATQMAIWSCSNNMEGVEFVNSHYVGKESDLTNNDGALKDIPAGKEDQVYLMFKLYEYLTGLAPTEVENTTADTIINENNFLKDLSLTVISKSEDHANNADDDDSNDAYVTNIAFSLVVTPSADNGDSLVITVYDALGEKIASGRIAGEVQEGETLLVPDENGNYCFESITLIEGDQNFNITLDGVQNLTHGVYLYTSEVVVDEASGDETTSQTMVGLASGMRDVDVTMDIKFELNVKDEVIVTEHIWREESNIGGTFPPQNPPSEPNDPPEVPQNPPVDPVDPPADPVDPPVVPEIPPMEEIPDEDVPLVDIPEEEIPVEIPEVEIPEEDVPLAEVPQTGDNSVIWFALTAILAAAFAALFAGKKIKA